MKSELSFLTDLFLNEEVSAPIKKVIATRIKEVEKSLTEIVPRGTVTSGYVNVPNIINSIPASGSTIVTTQAPSMQKIMERNPDLVPAITPPVPTTPAAAQALQQRASLLKTGMSEKPESGRSSPRKI